MPHALTFRDAALFCRCVPVRTTAGCHRQSRCAHFKRAASNGASHLRVHYVQCLDRDDRLRELAVPYETTIFTAIK
jgi:hypothetical protein